MRVLANSIPKSGTHLLLRLLTLLDFDLVDFGGVTPRVVSERKENAAHRTMRKVLGTREPGKFLGIGPHLLEGGRFPAARELIRTRGSDKITVGVEFPREIGRRWLERRLNRVPDDSVVSAHCVYTQGFGDLLSEQKMRTVCIIRDPRDTAVSHMHYVKQRPRHRAYKEYMALPNDHERLMASIRGGKLGPHTLHPLDERYRRFLGWEREGGAVTVKFEDLVGPKGGGSEEAQRAAVVRIVDHLGLDVGDRTVGAIQERLFGSGRTFRKGQTGGWKQEFSEEHREAAREVAGELLVELGYERSTDW